MPWHDLGQYNKPVVDRAWRKVLGGWLQWDQSRIESWMRIWEPDLRDEGNLFFYHDPVMRAVVGLFIDDDLAECLRGRPGPDEPHALKALTWELEGAFEQRDHRASAWRDDFDWALARQAVDAALARHDSSIPGPETVTAYERRVRARCS